MENPADWTPIHHAIADALKVHAHAVDTGTFGLSLVGTIYATLEERGYLVPQRDEVGCTNCGC